MLEQNHNTYVRASNHAVQARTTIPNNGGTAGGTYALDGLLAVTALGALCGFLHVLSDELATCDKQVSAKRVRTAAWKRSTQPNTTSLDHRQII